MSMCMYKLVLCAVCILLTTCSCIQHVYASFYIVACSHASWPMWALVLHNSQPISLLEIIVASCNWPVLLYVSPLCNFMLPTVNLWILSYTPSNPYLLDSCICSLYSMHMLVFILWNKVDKSTISSWLLHKCNYLSNNSQKGRSKLYPGYNKLLAVQKCSWFGSAYWQFLIIKLNIFDD